MARLLNTDKKYWVYHGDCVPHLYDGMPAQSVDFSVFSPPFCAVYAYTSSGADLGNTEDLRHEAPLHFSWFFRGMLRVMRPGRVMLVHCAQIVRQKRSGGRGLFDFRGLLIRLGQRAGFTYDYDWCVRKAPQAQAIRTKSRALQFAGFKADRAQSRGANPDYLIKFLAPGENAVPIQEDSPTNEDWIKWAECTWGDIRETDTLNVREARSEEDTKHICALQLPLIERAIRLYTNPGEIVFSPFAGIGSELHEALRLGRRAYGCELKDEYYAAAMRNCDRALGQARRVITTGLFRPIASNNGK